MKVVIFCGGKGTRLSNINADIPKPLINVGKKPLVCHIMDVFLKQDFNEFILLTGYNADCFSEYFSSGYEFEGKKADVHCFDTGVDADTGERLMKAKSLLKGETFICTYGDGLADIDFENLLTNHEKNKTVATITLVHPENPFGVARVNKNLIYAFDEKPRMVDWVNGGFFVFNKNIFKFLRKGMLEDVSFKNLLKAQELGANFHNGFWCCMDTFKDWNKLNELCKKGDFPWLRI